MNEEQQRVTVGGIYQEGWPEEERHMQQQPLLLLTGHWLVLAGFYVGREVLVEVEDFGRLTLTLRPPQMREMYRRMAEGR